jgi:hypothetical protein
MIKGDFIMSTKKEFTIEELEAQYKLAEEKRNALKQQIEQKKKEEKKLKEAKLAREKAARKKEVDDAVSKAIELMKAWTNDFGVYSYKSDDDNAIFGSKLWNWIW